MAEKKDLTITHSPFTAYVDHSFNPTKFSTSPTKSPKPNGSDLDAVLRTKDRKRIRAFVRDGQWEPTHEVRKVLWWKLSSTLHKDSGSSSIYDQMVKELFGDGATLHDVTMPGFVDMTRREHYHISEAGIHIAKKVICILGNTCPDITYAPLLLPLACLLLHYMDESECYNCLYGLVRSTDGYIYIMQTKKAHEAIKHVLKDLAKKYCKGWSSYVAKRGLQAEGVLNDWLWWIFRDLPFSHLVRIMDCFLVEGPKILYRVGLAILTLFHKNVVKPHPKTVDGDLGRAVRQFCEDLSVSPEKLMKVAFGIRGLSRKEIKKLKVKSEMFVESLRHAPLPHTIPKSESCESLNLKVSRSFSGPTNLQSVDSNILDKDEWQVIWPWLPTRITLNQPTLLYTSSEHGTSLLTFYSKIDDNEPTLLIIKTDKHQVIGAYCSADWANRTGKQKQYFGTGESFVFTLQPQARKFPWVGLKLQGETPNHASQFMRADSTSLSIGGGGKGTALTLDENLYQGSSQRCDTFDNDPLVPEGDFHCLTVEVFGFVESQ